jgi:hypothetical protein
MFVTSAHVVISAATSPFADELAECMRTVYTPTLITLDLHHTQTRVSGSYGSPLALRKVLHIPS